MQSVGPFRMIRKTVAEQNRQTLDRADFVKCGKDELVAVANPEFPEQLRKVHFHPLVGKVDLLGNLFDRQPLDHLAYVYSTLLALYLTICHARLTNGCVFQTWCAEFFNLQ